MLAVLPIDNLTGSDAEEYVSTGVTEELIAELSRLNPSRLGVIARTSTARFKGAPVDVPSIGRELGVDYLLEGSLRRSGRRLRITVQLVRVKDQSHLWSQSYDRDGTDILSVQQDVAERAAREMEVALLSATPGRPTVSVAEIDAEARDAYLRGRFMLSRGTGPAILKGKEYLEEAVRRSPGFAPSRAWLATAWLLLTNYAAVPAATGRAEARAAAEAALALDPSEPQGHLALAGLEFEHDWNFAGAEADFADAIRERPSAQAHQWYAALLSALGRFDEAIAESRLARQLDPLAPRVAVDLGRAYYFARQYDRAIAEYRAVLEMEPNYSSAHSMLGLALLEKGLYDEGIGEIEKGLALLGTKDGFSIWLGYAYGVSGRREAAERVLDRQTAHWNEVRTGAQGLALTFVGLGDKDRAFEWLERAYAERSGVSMLKAFPYWDPLRSDPRFDALLRRVGLEK